MPTDEHGRYVPGPETHVGKGGKANAHALRTLMKMHTNDALDTLLHLMMNSDDDKVRLAAAKYLIDQTEGKAMIRAQLETSNKFHHQVALMLPDNGKGPRLNGVDGRRMPQSMLPSAVIEAEEDEI